MANRMPIIHDDMTTAEIEQCLTELGRRSDIAEEEGDDDRVGRIEEAMDRLYALPNAPG